MMLVALTGSIGMGKTETLKIFKKKGACVFDSDAAVHSLYEKGGRGTELIKALFPDAITNGAVDRKKLSKIVLAKPEAIEKIEQAIHPLVKDMQAEFVKANRNAPLIVMDIPLLFEQGREADFDKIIVVTAPASIQRERVLKRPGMSEEKYENILSLQTPDAEKRAKADFIIETDKGFSHAEARVDEILKELSE